MEQLQYALGNNPATQNGLMVYYPWFIVVIILAALWTIPWKAVALWKSARNGHKWWFIILMFVNTLAILEIIYIFGFSKKHKE
jgi:hypothetical protein